MNEEWDDAQSSSRQSQDGRYSNSSNSNYSRNPDWKGNSRTYSSRNSNSSSGGGGRRDFDGGSRDYNQRPYKSDNSRGDNRDDRSDRSSRSSRGGNNFPQRERRDRDDNRGDCETFEIPSNMVGKVIGRGGSQINELQDKSSARIQVTKEINYDNTVVKIFGEQGQIEKAKELISELISGGNDGPPRRH